MDMIRNAPMISGENCNKWIKKTISEYKGMNTEKTYMCHENILNLEVDLIGVSCEYERILRNVKKDVLLIEQKNATFLKYYDKKKGIMLGVFIKEMLLNIKFSNMLLGPRLDWSIFSPTYAKLGRADNKILSQKLFISMNWKKATDIRLSTFIKEKIDQGGWWFVLFFNPDFFFTVEWSGNCLFLCR